MKNCITLLYTSCGPLRGPYWWEPPFAIFNIMINLKYKKCHVSICGDYYQIMFDNDYDEPDNYDDIDEVIKSIGPYFLVQFTYEFPGKECYIESDDENLRGHYIVNSVIIGHRTFTINYAGVVVHRH